MMKYRSGHFEEENEFGIFEQHIDHGNDWYGKIVVYGASEQEVGELANKIIVSLNQLEGESK